MIKKANTKKGPDKLRLGMLVVVVLGALVALIVGLSMATGTLREIWQEQYKVTDQELDVVITTGKRVKPEIIVWCFGLTNGANLATIPFEEHRSKLLKSQPNIRDIRIERRLPNRVIVDVSEREPLVRVVQRKSPNEGGRVADNEGVVFRFEEAPKSLPVIVEPTETPTVYGKKLTDMASSALLLVEVAAQPEFADMRIRKIDTSHSDYLLAEVSVTGLDATQFIQIAWDHMQDKSKESRESLTRQLKCVCNAMSSRLTIGQQRWIATDWSTPVRITATPIISGVK